MILPVLRAAIKAATAPSWRSFMGALEDPARAQERVLARIVADASATRYGGRHKLSRSDSYQEFSSKLPIVDYDALAPWIDAQREEEDGALCAGRVLFYETTSGSSGPAKFIPYTAPLYRSFGRVFSLWLRDLLTDGPRLTTGRTWLSVSQFSPPETATSRGVKIGLENDADYVGGWLGAALAPFWVVPPAVRRLTDPLAFRDAVALHLLQDEGLELVSLWNPSMLTAFLDHIARRRDALLPALSLERRKRLSYLLESGDAEKIAWRAVWPRLKLLSCWDQAHAAEAARTAAAFLPGVLVQGKGHLATEAPVTIPLIRAGGFVPVADETFMEFQEASGRIVRLHELQDGGEYELIVSQRGGLCRYRLGDRVRAQGRYKSAPLLRLLGRADDVCDLVGEKLHADFVGRVLADAAPESRFRVLVPVPAARGRAAGYLFVADRANEPGALARAVDAGLSGSPHFRSARLMGQLSPVEAVVRPDAREAVERFFVARGRVWGALKPAPLVQDLELGRGLAEALR